MTDRANDHRDATARSVMLLGVPVEVTTIDDAVERTSRFVQDGRATDRWHQISTVNLDFLTNAVRDDALRTLLQHTDLNIADGMPLVWAARALGTPLDGRVTGVDLVDAITARAAVDGWRVFLFGGGPGVAGEAAARLVARHPGADVVHGSDLPPIPDVEAIDGHVLDEIRAARPDVLCVALGNPKQEWFIRRYGGELGVPVLIGVGGTLDFIVGRRRRAPGWMQRIGLEWLARFVQEPRRLGPRYARDLVVTVPRFAIQWWHQRPDRSGRPWRPSVVDRRDDGAVEVVSGPQLDLARDDALAHLTGPIDRIDVDLAAVGRPDSRTVSTIASLARSHPGRVHVIGVRPETAAGLERSEVLRLLVDDAPGRAAP